MNKKYNVSDKFKEKLLYFKLSIIDKDTLKNKYILKDIAGYKYFLSNGNISTLYKRNGQPRRYFGGNPYTKENIINYLKENNINIELKTEDFKKATAITNLTFYCPRHGKFQKSWNSIKNGSYCPICGNLKATNKRRNNIEDIKLAFEKRGYILITNKYINNLQHLQYICKKHKDKGMQCISWCNFISKKKCIYCSKEQFSKKTIKSSKEFEKQIKLVYGDKFTLLSPYTGCKDKIKIYCNDCHTEFLQQPNHLLEGHLGCNCQPKSLGEQKTKEILDRYKINYKQQYLINQCRNKRPLPFDFAIFNNKKELSFLIEYQGRQHYYIATFGGISKEQAKKNFYIQQYRDKIKRQYCIKHNIKLIELPFNKFDNVEQILVDILINNNIHNKYITNNKERKDNLWHKEAKE